LPLSPAVVEKGGYGAPLLGERIPPLSVTGNYTNFGLGDCAVFHTTQHSDKLLNSNGQRSIMTSQCIDVMFKLQGKPHTVLTIGAEHFSVLL